MFKSRLLLVLIFLLGCFDGGYAITVSNLRHDIYVSPGRQAIAKVKVANESKLEQSVKIYFSDYMHFADGSNKFADPGTLKRSNANWLSAAPIFFTLKPGMDMQIPIAINVPVAELEGTYWSMLMIEPVDKSEIMPVTGNAATRSGVKIISRQGVQIRTHITNTGAMKARFFNQKIEKREGKTFFTVDLENTGNIFYRGDFWVELFNQEGYPSGKIQISPRGVYPECSVRLSADISKFKAGNYTAVCVFDTRGNKVFGGKYQIQLK